MLGLGQFLSENFAITINYIYNTIIKSIPNIKALLFDGTNKIITISIIIAIVIFMTELLLKLLKWIFYLLAVIFVIFLLFKFMGLI